MSLTLSAAYSRPTSPRPPLARYVCLQTACMNEGLSSYEFFTCQMPLPPNIQSLEKILTVRVGILLFFSVGTLHLCGRVGTLLILSEGPGRWLKNPAPPLEYG